MATTYPESIDTVITLPTATDNFTPIRAITVNALRDAIIEIEAELGVQPASIYGTVKNRLDVLEFLITGNTSLGTTFFSGDLTGNFSGQEVIGFYGRPLVDGVPDIGQVYSWDGYQWALTLPASGMGYVVASPDTNANWSGTPPTTVQEAIARIAALLGGGGSTPIP